MRISSVGSYEPRPFSVKPLHCLAQVNIFDSNRRPSTRPKKDAHVKEIQLEFPKRIQCWKSQKKDAQNCRKKCSKPRKSYILYRYLGGLSFKAKDSTWTIGTARFVLEKSAAWDTESESAKIIGKLYSITKKRSKRIGINGIHLF